MASHGPQEPPRHRVPCPDWGSALILAASDPADPTNPTNPPGLVVDYQTRAAPGTRGGLCRLPEPKIRPNPT